MLIENELLYFQNNHGVLAVLTNVLLTSLADAIIVAKRLLKGKTPLGLDAAWRHSALLWSLCRRTRWGMRPTR